MKKIDYLTLAEQALKISEDKKGENAILLDVQGQTALTNYFVIVTATSTPQINAIASEIEKTFKYDFELPVIRRDGVSSANWKVLDFGGLIVHIMNPSTREQYNLETIWTQLEKKEESIIKKKATPKKKSVVKKVIKKTIAKKTTRKPAIKKKKK